MKYYVLWSAMCIGCLSFFPCQAGRIIIAEPASQRSQTETNVEQSVDNARQYLRNTPSHYDETYVEGNDTTNQAGELRHGASEYLGSASGTDSNGQTILILRTDTRTDAEKARTRARSYVAPATTQNCVTVAENQVGTIGGELSDSSNNRGSVVLTRCR